MSRKASSMSMSSLEDKLGTYRTILGASAEHLKNDDLEILIRILESIADIAIKDNLDQCERKEVENDNQENVNDKREGNLQTVVRMDRVS